LLEVYGEAALNVGTFRRWVRRIKAAKPGGAVLHGKQWKGRICELAKGDDNESDLQPMHLKNMMSECLPSSS